MPMDYACPHCGKRFSVAEQYAGQAGPCAACGKPITIPMPAGPYAYAPQAGGKPAGGGGGVVVVLIAIVGCLIMCSGVLAALLIPAIHAAREAARRAQSSNNMRQIGLALHSYHDRFGSFPPAIVTDSNGRPLYSGRVLILPFLEQVALYEQFDLNEPWDSPKNLSLSQTTLQVFVDPSGASGTPGRTDYVFVTGKGTVFEPGAATKFVDITDGVSNTMVVVEVRNAGTICWAEPKDLEISQPVPLPAGNHSGGNIVLMGDGAVRFISKAVPAQTIRDAATKAGGEMTSLP